jgi:hypothetical protein
VPEDGREPLTIQRWASDSFSGGVPGLTLPGHLSIVPP